MNILAESFQDQLNQYDEAFVSSIQMNLYKKLKNDSFSYLRTHLEKNNFSNLMVTTCRFWIIQKMNGEIIRGKTTKRWTLLITGPKKMCDWFSIGAVLFFNKMYYTGYFRRYKNRTHSPKMRKYNLYTFFNNYYPLRS